jgi:glycerol-3-phosphate acyltransferase PlsX
MMQRMMRIAIDVMGGDNAPQAVLQGCEQALSTQGDMHLVLCGPREVILEYFSGKDQSRITIDDAQDVISNHDSPTMAVRRKTDSSLVHALDMVKRGDCQAMVSAGSTGALLAGGVFRVGRIRGIQRPALAPVMPSAANPWMLIDCGANADCRPDYLTQFAMMGSAYMKAVMGVENPRVKIVNIGDEAEKGNELVKAAYPLLEALPGINFQGNIEARDIMFGGADVVVCDGFTGNVILKHTEGTAMALMGMLKDALMKSTKTKLAAAMLRGSLREFKARMDYTEYGGAPLLGVKGVMIKAHGSSNARAYSCAIAQAVRMICGGVVASITREIEGRLPSEE